MTEVLITEKMLEQAAEGGWIGVDFDATLFEYHGWVGWNVFGAPIPAMIEHVQAWLAAGIPVRIVTARIGLPVSTYTDKITGTFHNSYSYEERHKCRVSGVLFSDNDMETAILKHIVEHGLPRLPVQCYKDVGMIELWDDRAVQVVPNTGRTLAEEHAAQIEALRDSGPTKMDIEDNER